MMDTATAVEAVHGMLRGENAWFDGVAIDSRVVRAGELFVALRGERFDGHDYVARAFERGAAAAMVALDRAASLTGNLVAVSDPLRGLGALATFWRERFTLPIAGVVGSNGKTTVKEMIAAMLRTQFAHDEVHATAGNLNTTRSDCRSPCSACARGIAPAVVEIGMNHAGRDRRARRDREAGPSR